MVFKLKLTVVIFWYTEKYYIWNNLCISTHVQNWLL